MAKKIVHIVAHYPPFLGGTERVAYEVATEQARQGEIVEVVTSTIGYKKGYKDSKISGYTVTRLAGISLFNVPIIPALLFSLLRQPRDAVFHVHVVQAFIPEIAVFAARLRGAKVIMHFHLDVVASGTFGIIFTWYKRLLFARTLRAAQRIIVFSQDQAKLVTQKYKVEPSAIAIIPNGVASQYFFKGERTLPAKPTLLFVGRLSPQKNVQQLLHALHGVSDTFQTIIVGEGSLAAELQKLSRDLALQNVAFLGRVEGEELLTLYRQATVFVLPSEREGMPLVVIEAMAMGLPVVATDVLGTRDLVKEGQNGLLATYNSPASLRKALLTIVSNASRYAKLSKGAQLQAKGYTWAHVVGKLREVYNG